MAWYHVFLPSQGCARLECVGQRLNFLLLEFWDVGFGAW